MPQFDFYSFSGQVFWTLLGFLFFYFFILKYYLVPFSEVFKMRQKLFNQTAHLTSDKDAYQKKIYTFFI